MIHWKRSNLYDATSLGTFYPRMKTPNNPALVNPRFATPFSRPSLSNRAPFRIKAADVLRSIFCPPLSSPQGQGRKPLLNVKCSKWDSSANAIGCSRQPERGACLTISLGFAEIRDKSYFCSVMLWRILELDVLMLLYADEGFLFFNRPYGRTCLSTPSHPLQTHINFSQIRISFT